MYVSFHPVSREVCEFNDKRICEKGLIIAERVLSNRVTKHYIIRLNKGGIMKLRESVVVVILLLLPLIAIGLTHNLNPAISSSLSEEWFTSVLEQIRSGEYNPSLQALDHEGEQFSKPRYHFANRAKNLRAYFDEHGMELLPRTRNEGDAWSINYRLSSIDYTHVGECEPEILNNKIVYQYQGVHEDYINSEAGILQTLVIEKKLVDPLVIKANVVTRNILLSQNTGEGLVFSHNGDEIMFQITKVEDANEKVLSKSISYDGQGQFTISVDDNSLQYPIVVNVLISSNTEHAERFVYSRELHSDFLGLSKTPDWSAESNRDDAFFGYSVATAGDVNGDGYSDVIIGAFGYDNGQSGEGAAFVYHGSASGLPITADWMAESNQAGALFGYSVATAGDVNGDGYSDVVVGAYEYDNGQTDEGGVFVYHGSASGLSFTADWTAESDQAITRFGYSVAHAGDVNGDGYSDIIVGAYYYDNGETDEGATFVYHGSASGLSLVANWIAESDQVNAHFGYSVATAGDVNGDGYSDVIVGAYNYDNGEADEGRAFVYYGASWGLSPAANWVAESDQVGAFFGESVAAAGDVNGDGYSDVIVGAALYDEGETDEGVAFVYYGSYWGLSLGANWVAESDQEYAAFGRSVATAGDANGDGYSDVIVGASTYSDGETDEGAAFVYYGSHWGLSPSADWMAESDQEYAYFGTSVAAAGDVNGNGYSDVIIGAYGYDNGETDEGIAFVYHGGPSGLSLIANTTAEPNQANAQGGRSVSDAGDVNGDGYSDVIVGANRYDNGQENEGVAFVYHGSASGLPITANWVGEEDLAGIHFGSSVSSAGDVNGDGYSDVIIGAPSYASGQQGEGVAFVYHGSASGLSPRADWSAEPDYPDAHFGWSVSNAGDVNGDGYSDVIIGAYGYDNMQENEGRAYVYHGSASGVTPTADWIEESDQDEASYGYSVSTAGDVNGDGFSDIIVGANGYDNGEDNEGRAYVYHGSASGVETIPSWIGEPNQENAAFGHSVSTAGDVNGDGYSDVIIGAVLLDSAYVYHGSTSGLDTISAWVAGSDQVNTFFGGCVSSAGDVNGDGYSDVIVGAPRYNAVVYQEGRAFVYDGGASGLSQNYSWYGQTEVLGAAFGGAVSTAGDVNGDGCSDVIVGAINYSNGEDKEGGAFVYHGNLGGLALVPRQAVPDGSRLVQLLNATNSPGVQLKLLGRTPAGRGKVKLQWEVKEFGQPFDGTDVGISSNWYDTGIDGVEMSGNASLMDSTAYHWRLRLMYSPVHYNGSVYSRWLSIGPNGMNEMDFITHNIGHGIEEEYANVARKLVMSVLPTVSSHTFNILYTVSTNEVEGTPVTVNVYDVSGRLVKTIFTGNVPAGSYETSWHGDDNQNRNVANGIYFISLTYGKYKTVEKALLIK